MGRIPHRPGGPWTGIFLAASILGSYLQPAPAQTPTPVTIVLTPPSPAVGGGVSLAPPNPPQDFTSCSWYRSATADGNSQILTYNPGPPPVQTNGLAHTGRETAGLDCSLHIAGLMLNDTGSYTVQIQSPTSPVLTTVHLPVSASVLGSCLQPAPAQTPVTIVLTPPSPAVGGGVSLAPQNQPQDFTSCSWYRSDNTDASSRILSYFPGPPPVQTNGSAHTGRETAGPGCALHIAGLRLSDTGNYTVDIQSPTSPGLGTVHLPVSASVLGSCLQLAPAQTPVTIVLTPPSPAVGGGVSLAPQNPPQDFVSCSWYRSATTDPSSRILSYFPGPPPVQNNDLTHTGRETAGPDCTLHIAGLRLNDTGSYTVDIQSPTSPAVTTTVHLPVSAPVAPRPGLSAGAVAGIFIGSLAGAVLVGVGAYFLYSRSRNETPRETGAPVLVYENLPPKAGKGPVAQPGSPPDPSPMYQTLQPRQQDVYEELKK
ncbi:unnamed protein product [Lepidochelys olivacea]